MSDATRQPSSTLDPSVFNLASPGQPAPFMLAATAEEAGDRAEQAHAADGQDDDAHGEEAHAADAHGETQGYTMPEELPNFYTLIASLVQKKDAHHDEEAGHHAPWWVNPMFSAFYAALFCFVVWKIMRRPSIHRPGRAQVAVEMLFNGMMNFFGEVVGKENARKYVPFCGALFVFILLNNWFGLVPLFKSPTAHIQTTGALGLCTFLYVNWQGIKAGGLRHYLWHLLGAPTNAVTWALSPLFLFLEMVGLIIKPVSLAMRLFGNIFGEDKLLATFLGLGMLVTASIFDTATPMVGVPFHFPFMFLALLASTIQAVVFSLLAAVYIALLLPHEEHHHEEEHDADGDKKDIVPGHVVPEPKHI